MALPDAMAQRLPLLPLPYGHVMLPGSIIRVSLIDRADLQSLLHNILTNSKSALDATSVNLGCIPLAGRGDLEPNPSEEPSHAKEDKATTDQLEGEVKEVQIDSKSSGAASPNIDPASATPGDLFGYGTLARVIGIERGGFSGPSIVVEGLSRFKTISSTQRTPFLEAEVEYIAEHGNIIVPSHIFRC